MERRVLSRLKAWKVKADRKPLILEGARQVGKTHALRTFGSAEFHRTHYLNFEDHGDLASLFERDLDPVRIVQAISIRLGMDIEPGKDLLIFDEIQSAPKAITSLKYFAENLPGQALCAAGSLLGVHLGEASFPVGKVEFMDLHPFSFQEFLAGIGDTRFARFLGDFDFKEPVPTILHSDLWERWKAYVMVGGMPKAIEAYAANRDKAILTLENVRKVQNDLIRTYLADMAKHAGKVNSMHLERVLKSVPAQLIRTVDGSIAKFVFKDVVPGIQGYARLVGAIDWLKAVGLIQKVPIVNKAWIPLAAYAEDSVFKLCLLDVGLLCALGGIPAESILNYDFGSYKGYIAESFVLQELVCAGGPLPVSWRENTAEVEFLIELAGEIVPLEVKSGWVTKAKSLKVFQGKYKPRHSIIMSARNFSRNEAKGEWNVPIYLAGRVREMLGPAN